jgi:hypothetical protein
MINRIIFSIICAGLGLISVSLSATPIPEVEPIKKWYASIGKKDEAAMASASCADANRLRNSVNAIGAADLGSRPVDTLMMLSALVDVDFSRLDFIVLQRSPDGRSAYVQVRGDVGELKTWGGERVWTPFYEVVRRRQVSDIAIVKVENGQWKFCDYMSLDAGRRLRSVSKFYIPHPNDEHAEYDQAKVAFTSDQAKQAVGVWRGTYVCRQGPTGMTMSVNSRSDNGLEGILDFFPLPENSSVRSGTYAFRVLKGHTHWFIEPTDWIKRPEGYVFVGFSGVIEDSNKTFKGEVLLNGCGKFHLQRAQ